MTGTPPFSVRVVRQSVSHCLRLPRASWQIVTKRGGGRREEKVDLPDPGIPIRITTVGVEAGLGLGGGGGRGIGGPPKSLTSQIKQVPQVSSLQVHVAQAGKVQPGV